MNRWFLDFLRNHQRIICTSFRYLVVNFDEVIAIELSIYDPDSFEKHSEQRTISFSDFMSNDKLNKILVEMANNLETMNRPLTPEELMEKRRGGYI